MIKLTICLLLGMFMQSLCGADLYSGSYTSSVEGKDQVVRLIIEKGGDLPAVVSVTVNGEKCVGQTGVPGLNVKASDGSKELIFVAPMLKKGENKVVVSAGAAGSGKSFSFKDEKGKHVDILFGEENYFRYMYERIDDSDKKRREITYKPYHHVYDKNGKEFITKGAGGQFTHHRGIYYGFAKCTYPSEGGKTGKADTWHCSGDAHQTHEEFLVQEAGPVFARQRVKIDWHGQGKKVFATEIRELTFINANGKKVVDFASSLSTELEYVGIDGDPQHAGFQYRASNEVNQKSKKQTYYIRQNDGKDSPGKTKNWPGNKDMTNLEWKTQSTVVGGERYTVTYLDSMNNPKPSFYSERDYGRFGSYFKTKVTKDSPLKIRYRLVIENGEIEPAVPPVYFGNFKDSLK